MNVVRQILIALWLIGATTVGGSAQPPPRGDAHVQPSSSTTAALRARGIDLAFNLDYPEALAAFREAIAADPTDPAPYRMAASTVWIRLLFQQGAVTAEDYLGEARSKAPRRPPSEELTATFRDYADRAAALVDKRLRERPLDADSHFEAGSIAGVQASYTATIEGRMLGAVSAARRAYNEHKRCMELDSSRKDAGLIVGSYRYAVSTLPASFRVLAHIAGFSSGRDEGLRLVEEAAAYEDDPQPDALFALVVIYSREGRHADALRAIRKLQAAYPRNRLLWLEAGASALRAGRPGDALAALDEGLAKFARDPRPRAFGEEARWRYYRGTALAGLHQVDAAERELRSVLSGDAHEWIRGRAHVEIGKLADLSGRRSEALAEYRLALSACRADRDTMCLDDARRFTKTVYREEKGTNR